MINIKNTKKCYKGSMPKIPRWGGGEGGGGGNGGLYLTKFQYLSYRPQILHGSLYGKQLTVNS